MYQERSCDSVFIEIGFVLRNSNCFAAIIDYTFPSK